MIEKDFSQKRITTLLGISTFLQYQGETNQLEAERLFGRYRNTRNYPLAVASLQAKIACEYLHSIQYKGYFITSILFGASLKTKEAPEFEDLVYENEITQLFEDLSKDKFAVLIVSFSGGHTSHMNKFHSIGYSVEVPLLSPEYRKRTSSMNPIILDALRSYINPTQSITFSSFEFDRMGIPVVTTTAADIYTPNTKLYDVFNGEDSDAYDYIVGKVLDDQRNNGMRI